MCFCVIVLFCVFVRVLAVRPCACMFPCVFLSIRSCKCLHACVRVCVLCVYVCACVLLCVQVYILPYSCECLCVFLHVCFYVGRHRSFVAYYWISMKIGYQRNISMTNQSEFLTMIRNFLNFEISSKMLKKKLIARINKNICIIHSTIWRSHQCNLRRVKECTNNRRSSWRSWFQFFFAEDILNMVKFFSPPPFCLKKSQLWKSCWIWTKRGRPEVMFIESESSQDQKNFFGFQRFHADSRTLN